MIYPRTGIFAGSGARLQNICRDDSDLHTTRLTIINITIFSNKSRYIAQMLLTQRAQMRENATKHGFSRKHGLWQTGG